jgi:HPt (histidine-containing phosphotransfer) domain-containing protein
MISEKYKQLIIDSINKRFRGMGIEDEDTINMLIEESTKSLEEEISKVNSIIESDDLSELGFHTHTIKGILLNIGLNDDAERFREIKHLFEEGKSEEEIKEITKERMSIFKN